MAAVFGRRLRKGAMTAAVAAAAVAALSASQAPGVTAPRPGGQSSADDPAPSAATGPDYFTDLPPLDSPTAGPTVPPGTGPGDAESESGLPATVLDAYKKAEAELATSKPGCNLPWQLLAAIGKVESGQARGGNVDANGTTITPILGPALNGQGFALIKDTDGGTYDGDTEHDRAVGPMQFIPSTWEWAGRDGNGDGKKDPNNVYDAALAAGHYLCRNDWDLSNADDLNTAILSYNNSSDYVALVLRWLEYYRKGVHEVPNGTGVLPRTPSGGNGTNSPAPSPSTTPPATPSPSPHPGGPGGPGGTGGGETPGSGGSTPGGGSGGSDPADPPTTPTTPAPTPAETVTKLADAGTGKLTAMAGDAFGERVAVRPQNAKGKGVAKVQVRFAIVGQTDARFTGGATTALVTTDSAGLATAPRLTAGEKTGDFTVRATVVGRSLPALDHTATVTARAADALARTSDKELSCVAGQEFADAVEVKATYKGAVAHGVAATATLVKAADDPAEADKGPYFKDADGKQVRTLKDLKTGADGLLKLPKLYADDAAGTFLLRIRTTGGATLTVELKVTAAPSGGASDAPSASASPSA